MRLSKNQYVKCVADRLSKFHHVNLDNIPDMDLYMDQLIKFMDEELDGIGSEQPLTSNMVNNYIKNKILPNTNKKKYTKDHIIIITLIYYFKNVLSIIEIKTILDPIIKKYFSNKNKLEMVYIQLFKKKKKYLNKNFKDFMEKVMDAEELFDDEYLKLFSIISTLSFDIYVKKVILKELIALYKKNEQSIEK